MVMYLMTNNHNNMSHQVKFLFFPNFICDDRTFSDKELSVMDRSSF